MPESVFTIDANQWSEHGYIYRDGQVLQYETDRKEQTHMEFSPRPVEDVIADAGTPDEIRAWLLACTAKRS